MNIYNYYMQTLIASIKAPGKIILSGQHAVVYGEDALAMAINLCCHARIYQSLQSSPKITMTSFGKEYFFSPAIVPNSAMEFNEYEKMKSAEEVDFEQIKFEYKCQTFFNTTNKQLSNKAYLIEMESEVPIGKCLGSSASFNTVLAASLQFICDPQTKINLQNTNRISKIFQKIEHGTPSGIDNFVATYGGLVLFNNSKQPQFQQIINEQILSKLMEDIHIVLVDSGKEKNTKEAVQKVRENCKQEKYQQMIKQIGTFSSAILENVRESVGWKQQILSICAKNHGLLRELGVSCPEVEEVVTKYQKQGKCSAKITGAGMGGFVLVLSAQPIEGQQVFRTKLSKEGVRVRKYDYELECEKVIDDFLQ